MAEKDEHCKRMNDQTDSHDAYKRWIWWLVPCNVIALSILAYIVSWIIKGADTEWGDVTTVTVTGQVGIAAANGVALQVLIAGQMTTIMDRQEIEMTKQRFLVGQQLDNMERQLTQNRELFIIDLQPAIIINSIVLENTINSGKFPVVFVTATNTGRSAANDVQVSLAYGFLDGKMQQNAQQGIFRENFDTTIEDSGYGVIGSQQPFYFDTQRFNLNYGSILDGVRA